MADSLGINKKTRVDIPTLIIMSVISIDHGRYHDITSIMTNLSLIKSNMIQGTHQSRELIM